MTEKSYGNIPRCGKSYLIYRSMIKKNLDATIHVVDEYIKYWSDDGVQEFYYDVSPLEVLEELKTTLITGEYPTKMVEE